MPAETLWMNADVHWTVPPHAPLDKDGLPITCDEGCAACEPPLDSPRCTWSFKSLPVRRVLNY